MVNQSSKTINLLNTSVVWYITIVFFSIINQSFLVIGNLLNLTRLAIVYFSSNCYGCQTLYRSTAGIYRLSSVEYEGRIVFH